MSLLSPLAFAGSDEDLLVIYSKEAPSETGSTANIAKPVPVLLKSYPWFDDTGGYDKAIVEQRQTYEPFILYFYASWCPYCKKFAGNILRSDRVVEALKPIIKVEVNGDTERGLMRKFGVHGYPSFLVVSRSGGAQEIRTDLSISQFLNECKQAGLKIKG